MALTRVVLDILDILISCSVEGIWNFDELGCNPSWSWHAATFKQDTGDAVQVSIWETFQAQLCWIIALCNKELLGSAATAHQERLFSWVCVCYCVWPVTLFWSQTGIRNHACTSRFVAMPSCAMARQNCRNKKFNPCIASSHHYKNVTQALQNVAGSFSHKNRHKSQSSVLASKTNLASRNSSVLPRDKPLGLETPELHWGSDRRESPIGAQMLSSHWTCE